MNPAESMAREIRDRWVPEGGFRPAAGGGDFRPDVLAWSILALSRAEAGEEWLNAPRDRLAAWQRPEGNVCIHPDHPDAFWPTPLAILAWGDSPRHREPRSRALRFLLSVQGRHWTDPGGSVFGHDPSLRGWPWTRDTHSMAEPTAHAVVALRGAGAGEHPRALEGIRMIEDRQLPGGGWHPGGAIVYGKEMSPLPETTGLALCALAGSTDRARVVRSLSWLQGKPGRVRAPLALGWALLGMAAWGEAPPDSGGIIREFLDSRGTTGPVDTVPLCILLLAVRAARGGRVL